MSIKLNSKRISKISEPVSQNLLSRVKFLKNNGEGGEAINKIVDRYQQQRDIMVSLLQSISGVECHLPEGTFFAFPDISSYGSNSIEISNYLLNHYKVATVPGNAFGPSGEGFFKTCF